MPCCTRWRKQHVVCTAGLAGTGRLFTWFVHRQGRGRRGWVATVPAPPCQDVACSLQLDEAGKDLGVGGAGLKPLALKWCRAGSAGSAEGGAWPWPDASPHTGTATVHQPLTPSPRCPASPCRLCVSGASTHAPGAGPSVRGLARVDATGRPRPTLSGSPGMRRSSDIVRRIGWPRWRPGWWRPAQWWRTSPHSRHECRRVDASAGTCAWGHARGRARGRGRGCARA